jgi:hypothetical protein
MSLPDDREQRAEAIFRHAHNYKLASFLLTVAVNEPKNLGAMIPSVMISAFALELCIKALIVLDTGAKFSQIWGHDYVELFRKLTPETTQKIKANYASQPRRQLEDRMRRAGADVPSFDETLAMSKDAFKNLRYPYEGKILEWIAGDIQVAIIAVLSDRKPEWFQ